jgi:hypothetical protein
MGEAMTEADWLTGADPLPLLEFLRSRGVVSDRKARLFACACCRLIWPLIPEGPCRQVVEVSERFADGTASPLELDRARMKAKMADINDSASGAAVETAEPRLRVAYAILFSQRAAWCQASRRTGSVSPEAVAVADAARQRMCRSQCGLLRELFGNPFQIAIADESWLHWNAGCVVKMAGVIYERRRFADLPILGDALEEAGCTDQVILDHCRASGEHVAGCWMLDLLLTKTP